MSRLPSRWFARAPAHRGGYFRAATHSNLAGIYRPKEPPKAGTGNRQHREASAGLADAGEEVSWVLAAQYSVDPPGPTFLLSTKAFFPHFFCVSTTQKEANQARGLISG